MGKNTLNLNGGLYEYLLSVSLRDDPLQKKLREATDKLEWGIMQISADQAQFMFLMLKLINARQVIEIGTFTGYSALVMARALPEDGRIIACDIHEDWTNTGKQYWEQAGVAHKIELRLAPALETLAQLVKDGHSARFDAAFIDADKGNMLNYYEYCLKLIRPGGLIMIDNVLWGGSVADRNINDDDTNAIRATNRFVYQDERVDISMVPVGDGLTLARKR
ncbi:MAG: class I SAM-dependent methyltransferase [Gammaproteobacteria bacterium]|nr:class I SAM-dependent methyltransferase [Gammaproteobacteria bacterium]